MVVNCNSAVQVFRARMQHLRLKQDLVHFEGIRRSDLIIQEVLRGRGDQQAQEVQG